MFLTAVLSFTCCSIADSHLWKLKLKSSRTRNFNFKGRHGKDTKTWPNCLLGVIELCGWCVSDTRTMTHWWLLEGPMADWSLTRVPWWCRDNQTEDFASSLLHQNFHYSERSITNDVFNSAKWRSFYVGEINPKVCNMFALSPFAN